MPTQKPGSSAAGGSRGRAVRKYIAWFLFPFNHWSIATTSALSSRYNQVSSAQRVANICRLCPKRPALHKRVWLEKSVKVERVEDNAADKFGGM